MTQDSPQPSAATSDHVSNVRFFSSSAARRYLSDQLQVKISRAHFYRLIANGRLPCIRIGCKILIAKSDLETFKQKCQRGERF